MLMFNLAIFCLTTSDLSWFMDLTFQVPIYIALYSIDFISSTSHIHTWVLFLFWLHLFILSEIIPPLFSSSILGSYLGSSSFSVLSFCLFIVFMGFSRQEYWSGLPLPSPVDHVLSFLFTMTHPSWVALHSMAHSFTELAKDVVHVINFISFLWLWLSFCLPSEG